MGGEAIRSLTVERRPDSLARICGLGVDRAQYIRHLPGSGLGVGLGRQADHSREHRLASVCRGGCSGSCGRRFDPGRTAAPSSLRPAIALGEESPAIDFSERNDRLFIECGKFQFCLQRPEFNRLPAYLSPLDRRWRKKPGQDNPLHDAPHSERADLLAIDSTTLSASPPDQRG